MRVCFLRVGYRSFGRQGDKGNSRQEVLGIRYLFVLLVLLENEIHSMDMVLVPAWTELAIIDIRCAGAKSLQFQFL
jgi:hypothetical protein